MRRTVSGMGVLSLLAALAVTVPAGVRAGDDDESRDKTRELTRIFDFSRGARLGVSLEDVDASDLAKLKLAEERGALVKDVEQGSAAEKAGLKEGDVILRYQGQDVHSASQLARMVRETPPGRKVVLDVQRDGAAQKLSATLAEGRGRRHALLGDFDIEVPPVPAVPPAPDSPGLPHAPRFEWNDDGPGPMRLFREMWRGRPPARLGVRYQELGDQLARYFKVEEGLLITSVEEGGAAEKAGVKAGDVVLKLNGRDVRGSDDFQDEIAKLEPGKEATLSLQRDGKPLELKLTVGGRKRSVPRATT